MDRYFTLKYPMQYGRNKTKTMVAVKIVFVWIVSFTISSPISIYGLIDDGSVFNDHICVITLKEFVIYGSIFAFYIPLCIMILTYTLTVRILWQNQHMMRTIDRSNFRMRPRNHRSKHKSCHVTTFLSPPSSDSRKDSHTDISSLARTPNIEKIALESDIKFLELKHVIDQSYIADISSNIPSSDHDQSDYDILDNENGINENDDTVMTASAGDIDTTTLDGNPMLNVPITTVQSPSSDDDDENSALISSSTERLSRSFTHSSTGSRFRSRASTNISNKGYLSTHSSLKIPKIYEKNNLQGSVSCSNFTESSRKEKDSFDSLGFHGNGLNRDFRSLEWCHHFYEIQEEMDECLRESKCERKLRNMEEVKRKLTSLPLKDVNIQKSTETKDSGVMITQNSGVIATHNTGIIATNIRDQLKPEQTVSIQNTVDSADDADTSSENNSEILSINLNPKSVYMYKLDVDGKQFPSIRSDSTKTNETSALNNDLLSKRRSYVNENYMDSDKLLQHTQRLIRQSYANENSMDSDKSSEHTQRLIRRTYVTENSMDSDKSSEHTRRLIRKPSSIKRFIYNCRKRHGIKSLISSKTTSNEKKASKVLGIIFGVFVILWTPFFAANILAVTCTPCVKYITPEMMSSFVWMGYIASLANPIIYTMFNTAFRTTFIKILSGKVCTQRGTAFHRSSIPSQHYSAFTDRRQTLTVLANGNHGRIHSDISANSR